MSCHKTKSGQVACSDRREEIGNIFFSFWQTELPPLPTQLLLWHFFAFSFSQLFVKIYKASRIEMTKWHPVKKKNYLQNSGSIFFSPHLTNARVAPLKWLIIQTITKSSSRSADLNSFWKKLIRFRRNWGFR